METEIKQYKVLKAFEFAGLAYQEGSVYAFTNAQADGIIGNPDFSGCIEQIVSNVSPETSSSTPDSEQPKTEPVSPETQASTQPEPEKPQPQNTGENKPWAGNHTVPR